MKLLTNLMNQPLGKILYEARLVHQSQIDVALMEQEKYSNLKLGEILAFHGWLKQETADFFADKIKDLAQEDSHLMLGNYLYQAGLLSQEDIVEILQEQKKLGVKFGALAVMRGFMKQETLDFFLKYFAPKDKSKTDFQYKDHNIIEQRRRFLEHEKETMSMAKNQSASAQNSPPDIDTEDINWIG